MENNQLKKKSKQGAFISLFGLLIVILVFVFAAKELTKLNEEIAEKKLEIRSLDSIKTSQQEEIDANRVIVDTLMSEINRLTDPNILPKSNSVELPGILDGNGRQIYDFTVWVTSSRYTLDRVVKVDYEFLNKTFILKKRSSNNSENGFLVMYRGWGCLSVVKITVYYDDDTSETIYFNMCEDLRSN